MVTKPPRQAALIVNGKSRKGREAFRDACRLLKDAGVELVSAKAVRDPRRLDGEVRAAVASGVPMVIVGGGDGSISGSVDHVVAEKTVFALLPLGTANSFARTLGIPLDIAGAVKVIVEGQVRRIDLGMIDADYFANCAAIGISPLIAKTVPHGLKKWLGRPGYLAWAALQMARFQPFTLKVSWDGGSESLSALEVRIANGAYHGGTELVETDVENGEIVVQAVVGSARTKLLWSWGLSLIGPQTARGTLREFRGKSFRVETIPPLPISIDGEVLARTPVQASISERAIRMVVPA
ncbi:YegS/Rv2252/BmrU family lipid kinase [Sphingomonas sp. AP4-R1]|uniref:diacylglycerol/lipid kinase family protein n=1 Tax=Sphingomonas sp. AP4-R1 TaxID=2735134 RepID=UPI001493B28A|nr:YegS/Rv2252/BmrU family lipid kinase [Sphingomonas sp. AP4-R1]QJU57481.1 YegS/Rv2252/BmrU family lipid kinase [Sphingomonas sp. AP4-R1]